MAKQAHDRTQHRFFVGFWPNDLAALDELAAMLQPDRPRPERANALRVAVHEALASRRNSDKKSRKGA